MATELASGFIKMTVEYGDAMEKLRKDFGKTATTATKAGKQSGAAFTKGVKNNTKGISGDLTKQFSKFAKTEAGKAGKQSGASFQQKFKSATVSKSGSMWRGMFGGATPAAQKVGGKAASAFGMAFKGTLTAMGITGVIAATVGGVKSVLDSGMSYERAMNNIKAVTSATDADMQKFRETAAALGADTQLAGVSAQDAANAMAQMAKGGLSAEEAMAAARGTLQLATAGQIDAAEAADIQTAAMNSFGIKGEEAASVADMFSNATRASQADLHEMGYALKMSGLTAKGFGMDLNQTLTALTYFGKMGVVGSDAGTMLKTSLSHLANPSNEASEAMNAMGLELYDQQGVFVGYGEMMAQVSAAAGGMKDQEFQAAAATLFGTDALRAAMAAKEGGIDMWKESEEAIAKEGAAAELAAAQMEGLPGVMEGLSNTFDAFKLAVFGALDEPLQALGNTLQALVSGGELPGWLEMVKSGIGTTFDIIKNVITTTIDIFQRFQGIIIPVTAAILAYKATVLVSAAVTNGMAIAQALWTGALSAHAIASKVAAAAQWALNAAMSANPIGLIVAAIVGLVAGLVWLWKNNETFRKVVKGAWEGIKTAVSKTWDFLKVVWEGIKTGLKAVGAAFNWLYRNVVKPVFSVLAFPVKVAWAIIKIIFEAIKKYVEIVGKVINWLWRKVFTPAWEGIKKAVDAAWQFIEPIWDAFKRGLEIVGEGVMWLWHNAFEPAWEGIKTGVSTAWDFLKGIFDKIKGGFTTLKDGLVNIAGNIKDGIKTAFSGLADIIKKPLRVLGGFLANIPTSVLGVDIPGASTVQGWGRSLQGLATGGMVKGAGGVDNVLAWLTRGEGVVTRGAMARGGKPLVAALNSGWVPPVSLLRTMLPGFKAGSMGVGSEIGVVEEIAKDFGLVLISGKRSNAMTASGTSYHLSGAAGDFAPPGGGNNTDSMLAFATYMAQNYGATMSELIYHDPRFSGMQVHNGEVTSDSTYAGAGNHHDHVHVAIEPGNGPELGSKSLPSGRRVSGGSVGPGGSTYALSAADQRKLGEKQSRLGILDREMAILERELDALDPEDQTKIDKKQIQIDKKQEAIDKVKADIDELQSSVGGSGSTGGGTSDNPYRKMAEGLAEIFPDFEGMADLFGGGAMETLMPPGFSSPFEWGSVKAGAGIMGFLSGFMPDPVSRALLSGGAAAMSGSGSGMVGAVKGLLPEPFGTMPALFPGEAGPDGQIPGGTIHMGTGMAGAPNAPGPAGGGNYINNYNGNQFIDPRKQSQQQTIRQRGYERTYGQPGSRTP